MLQRLGDNSDNDQSLQQPLLVKLLRNNATTSFIYTPESVGLDLRSADPIPFIITLQSVTATIKTDIAIETPNGTYTQISSHSSLDSKNNIHVTGGIMNPDCRVNIQINLYDQIFLLPLKRRPYSTTHARKIVISSICVVNTLNRVQYDSRCFGNTEYRE